MENTYPDFKVVYGYHPVTKEYVGEENAYLDELATAETKVPAYLLPAHTTPERPPEVSPEEKSVVVFNDSLNTWETVPDHRGETWYKDTTQISVHFPGDPVEHGLTRYPPATLLPDVKNHWKIEVQIYMFNVRDELLPGYGGFQAQQWADKAERARRFLYNINDDRTPEDREILEDETALRGRGETAKDLAKKQLKKAAKTARTIARMDGLRKRIHDRIDAVTVDDYEANPKVFGEILERYKKRADGLLRHVGKRRKKKR